MPTQKPKNFLVFMTDHQRGDTVLEGSPVLTPNLDRLRRRGVTFQNAYTPAPHCCPARATFFTGLYPTQHGVWNNVSVSNTLSRGLYDGVTCFSEDLAAAGYQMYFSGKWHVSQTQSPADRGFQLLHHNTNMYRSFPNRPEYSEWDTYNRDPIDAKGLTRQEGQILREGYTRYLQYGIDESPYQDAQVVQAAVQQLRRMDSSKPFFLYTGVLGPHDPYFVPQRFLDLYDPDSIQLPESFFDTMEDKPALYRRTRSRYSQLAEREQRESIRRFYAFCSYEDYLFGQLLDVIDEQNLWEDTVVVYCSDHGDYIGSHGLWAKGLPCFREAYQVCSIIGGAGIENPGRVCKAPVNLADYAPTFLDLAGVQVSRNFAGNSLRPFLENRSPDVWRTESYSQTNGNEIYGIQRAVWDSRYKYVFNSFDFDELYDLRADPHELHNLIYRPDPENSPYRDIVYQMCKKLWKFAHDTHDNCVNPYIMTALAPFGPGIIRDEVERF